MPSMLGCLVVVLLLVGVGSGCGLGLGLLLHWLAPAIDLGVGTQCGGVTTDIALLTFGSLMTLSEPSESEEALPPVW